MSRVFSEVVNVLQGNRFSFALQSVVILCFFGVLSGCTQIDQIDPVWQEKIWAADAPLAATTGATTGQREAKTAETSADTAAETTGETKISTTGLGTLTGAAVGGGIGLVIGSTTGAAGEGMALGAMAGAAAGTGFGYQLAGQQQKLARTRETVAAQDQMIVEQGQRLSEMRRSAGDGAGDGYQISAFNRPSSASENLNGIKSNLSGVDFQQKRSRLQNAERITVTEAQAIVSPKPQLPVPPVLAVPPPVLAQPALAPETAVMARNSSRPTEQISDLPLAAPIQPQLQPLAHKPTQQPMLQMPPANTLPPAKTEVVEEIADQEEVADREIADNAEQEALIETPDSDSKIVETAVQEPKKIELNSAANPVANLATKPEPVIMAEPKAAPKLDAVSAATVPAFPSKIVSCPDAEQEALRARSATSDADKLFYFRRAIRLCPEKPDYYVEIGRVYVGIGRTQDAQSEFGKALEIDPDHERAQEELNMIMLGAAY